MQPVDRFIVIPRFFPEAKIIVEDVWNQTTPLCNAVWMELSKKFRFGTSKYLKGSFAPQNRFAMTPTNYDL